MKRLFITGMIAAMAFSTVAKAELEISGNVTTMAGYQHDDADATATGSGGGLTQGDWGTAGPASNADHFRFVLDQVEIDLDNEFGENIRARADIDFRDVADTGIRAGDVMDLEQGYVTANLGVGNGMEFLVGKFNIPMGLESNDRHENVFSTYTPGYQYLAPTTVMGSKIYYEFNDNWNFDLGVVNNLNNTITGNSAYPSGFLRVGAVWGDEGDESYINFAASYGPEHNLAGSNNAHYDMMGHMWGNWALGDYWDLGWEAIYRSSNTVTGTTNQRAFAGQLYAVYEASDAWTVQGRVAAFDEVSGFAAGTSGASTTGGTWSGGPKGLTYSGTFGATYNIADDAAMKWEFRYDLVDPSAGAKADYWTGVAEFAYSF